MKKILTISLLLMLSLSLASCGNSDAPLTEAQQAEKYNMTVEEYSEMKQAAASMNMTIEDHMKMMNNGEEVDHDMMDMGDDSSMIEDDTEMNMEMKMEVK